MDGTMTRASEIVSAWAAIGAVIGLLLTPAMSGDEFLPFTLMAAGAAFGCALAWRRTRRISRRW